MAKLRKLPPLRVDRSDALELLSDQIKEGTLLRRRSIGTERSANDAITKAKVWSQHNRKQLNRIFRGAAVANSYGLCRAQDWTGSNTTLDFWQNKYMSQVSDDLDSIKKIRSLIEKIPDPDQNQIKRTGGKKAPPSKKSNGGAGIKIFISHSHSDKEVARALVHYLLAALDVTREEIRCTSVAGHGLPYGQTIHERLREDIDDALGFLALLTAESLDSTWVKFELGGAWVKRLGVIPILGPGLTLEDHRLGPLAQLPCISVDQDNFLESLADAIQQLAKTLGVKLRGGGAPVAEAQRFRETYRRTVAGS